MGPLEEEWSGAPLRPAPRVAPLRWLPLRAALSGALVLLACEPAPDTDLPSGGEDPGDPPAPLVASDPEEVFHEVEQRLLDADRIALDFEITSEGVYDSSLAGRVELVRASATADGAQRLSLSASGIFGGAVRLGLETRNDSLMLRRSAAESGDSALALPTPPALRDAVVIGLTRMGLLHNLARLTGPLAPDRAEGGAAAWVTVGTFAPPPAEEAPPDPDAVGTSFEITVDGNAAGRATLWVDRRSGLPILRRQVVEFPQGRMEVVERYRPAGARSTASAPAVATAGMVSSAHPLATRAGVEVLERGGNAFDAAVAVAAALNVVEPMMSGVGGYGTIMVYDVEEGRARFLNPSGRIPEGVDPDVYRAPTPGYMENRRGAKAVSTPGNANAWEAMWRAYGSLPWQDLFDHAIRYAEEGFEVSPRTASLIANAFDDFPEHARTFYGRDGAPLPAGDLLVQRDLGATLRSLATEGAEVIHGGAIGVRIDAAMREAEGFLTLDDLAQNEAEWWEPISIEYRGLEIVSASPPANTFDALVRLGMMSLFDNAALGHNSTPYLHRFAEVTKHGFWVRLRWAGDPEVNPPPLDRLLSRGYWEDQVAALDLERASDFEYPSTFSDGSAIGRGGAPARVTPEIAAPDLAGATRAAGLLRLTHTTHFVVADRWGNVVSATQTLGNSFGSRIMPEGTGIWLNNSLAYSTFEPPGNPMDAHPGRRKLSGDVPTLIMRGGRPWVAIGTPGGHTIGQTVPQMVINLIDFDMGIQEAIAAARISFIEPDQLALEREIPREVRDSLAAMGHDVVLRGALGNAHGLTIEYGPEGRPIRFTGGADPRGEGVALGVAAGPGGSRD